MQERDEDRKLFSAKTCTRCGNTKDAGAFYESNTLKSGYRSECKDCSREVSKQYPKTSEQIKDSHLKSDYGITIEDYNKLFVAQEGKCLICRRHQSDLKRKLNVDHDHATGKVRGLLCNNCNSGLGHFKDDQKVMLLAIEYLVKSKELV